MAEDVSHLDCSLRWFFFIIMKTDRFGSGAIWLAWIDSLRFNRVMNAHKNHLVSSSIWFLGRGVEIYFGAVVEHHAVSAGWGNSVVDWIGSFLVYTFMILLTVFVNVVLESIVSEWVGACDVCVEIFVGASSWWCIFVSLTRLHNLLQSLRLFLQIVDCLIFPLQSPLKIRDHPLLNLFQLFDLHVAHLFLFEEVGSLLYMSIWNWLVIHVSSFMLLISGFLRTIVIHWGVECLLIGIIAPCHLDILPDFALLVF